MKVSEVNQEAWSAVCITAILWLGEYLYISSRCRDPESDEAKAPLRRWHDASPQGAATLFQDFEAALDLRGAQRAASETQPHTVAQLDMP